MLTRGRPEGNARLSGHSAAVIALQQCGAISGRRVDASNPASQFAEKPVGVPRHADGMWVRNNKGNVFVGNLPPDFPDEHVPQETGLIVADRYGGSIVKEAQAQTLHASRRKAVTVSFARCAAERLSRNLDAIALAQTPNLVLPDAADQS